MSCSPDIIRFEPEDTACPDCNSSLNVRNTRKRTIVTSSGSQEVNSVTKNCPNDTSRVLRTSKRITPPRRKYGFDVITDIGILRQKHHKQFSEIGRHFERRGIHIPDRTIENLYHVFLIYIVAVHLESFPKLAKSIRKQGGYVLHIDGTTTKGSPQLLAMKDGWSGITLFAASIPTEAADYVRPHIETIHEGLGKPVVPVRDMGDGITNALVEVFPGIYIITCHFHFLRAVGTRFFDNIYFKFQRRVDRTGIKKKLRKLRKRFEKRKKPSDKDEALAYLDYIQAYKKDCKGLSYPFSLPTVEFYRRCEEVRPKIRQAILDRAWDDLCSPCLSKLEDAIKLVKPPPAVRGRIHSEYLKLKNRWDWFEKIRIALRYRNGPIPLNTKGFLSNEELDRGREMLKELQKKLDSFITKGDSKGDRSLKRVLKGISDLIAEQRDRLFVPNVEVMVNGLPKVKKLPRTNNMIEQEFRSLRRHGRRIRGDGDVERSVQKHGVGLAIASNLKIREYVRLVYGTLDQMPARFSNVVLESLDRAKALF